MRNIESWLFVSLDGVVESHFQWQFDNTDEDVMQAVSAYIASEDAILLGRETYQEWLKFWPTSTNEPYASYINNTPKYVVSHTLDVVEWGQWEKPVLINGDLVEKVTWLKQQPGKNISVTGGPTLIHSLMDNDLLDALTLIIYPVIVGRGKCLFGIS